VLFTWLQRVHVLSPPTPTRVRGISTQLRCAAVRQKQGGGDHRPYPYPPWPLPPRKPILEDIFQDFSHLALLQCSRAGLRCRIRRRSGSRRRRKGVLLGTRREDWRLPLVIDHDEGFIVHLASLGQTAVNGMPRDDGAGRRLELVGQHTNSNSTTMKLENRKETRRALTRLDIPRIAQA